MYYNYRDIYNQMKAQAEMLGQDFHWTFEEWLRLYKENMERQK